MAVLGDGSFWFLVYLLLLLTTGLVLYSVSFALAPRVRSPLKEETFESGQIPPGGKRVRLVMQYFIFLLLFMIFDVVSMLLFAWGYAFFDYGPAGSAYPVLLLFFLVPPIYLTLKVARQVGV